MKSKPWPKPGIAIPSEWSIAGSCHWDQWWSFWLLRSSSTILSLSLVIMLLLYKTDCEAISFWDHHQITYRRTGEGQIQRLLVFLFWSRFMCFSYISIVTNIWLISRVSKKFVLTIFAIFPLVFWKNGLIEVLFPF
jgi:hypothetical protein